MPFDREYQCFGVGTYLKNLLLISIPPDMAASSQANIWEAENHRKE
jgi:hypothetical protein